MTTPSPYSNHDEVWKLLPWYVNGTVGGAEAELVRNHLGICLSCRKELTEQLALQASLLHEPRLDISTKPSFEKLMVRIEQEDRRASSGTRNRNAGTANARWESIMRPLFPRALGFAIAGGLLAVSLTLLLRQAPGTLSQNYHTVADPGSLQRFAVNDVRVALSGKVSPAEAGALIVSLGGRIVEGPNPLGVYTVRSTSDDGSAASLSSFIEKLRANPAVKLAEAANPQTPDSGAAR